MFFEKKQLLNEKESKENCYLLGINIGRTNITVSAYNYKNNSALPIDLSNGFGKMSVRTVLQYRQENNEWVIGDDAINSFGSYGDDTVFSVISKLATEEKIKFGDIFYNVDEVLSKMIKEVVNEVLKKSPVAEIYGIMVSVPDDFNEASKDLVRSAVVLAGLDDIYIEVINVHKAILLNHYASEKIEKNEKVVVMHFGGEAMELSLFDITKGENIEARLLKKVFGENLGGKDIDEILLNKFYQYVEENGYLKENLTEDNITYLKTKATETKERLTVQDFYKIPFTFCVPPFIEKLEVSEFENLIKDFVVKTESLIKNLFVDTKDCDIKNIDKVIFSGGSTNMPWVKNLFVKTFGEEKIVVTQTADFDASNGACLYLASKFEEFEVIEILEQEQNVNIDIEIPYDIGFNINEEFYTVIKRGSSFHYCNKINYFNIDGEENLKICVFKRFDINDKIDVCKEIGQVTFDNVTNSVKVMTKIINNGEKLAISIEDKTMVISL